MKQELDDLEKELKEIELEEEKVPVEKSTNGSKESMQSIDDLRNFMHNVVGATQFEDIEKGTTFPLMR